jgi:UDP-2,3-diacylglucosamine pyrophosphatase LpxH
MAQHPLGHDILQKALDAYHSCSKNASAASDTLGIPRGTFNHRLKLAQAANLVPFGSSKEFSFPDLPSDTPDIDHILARREKIWKHKSAAAEARKLIPVTIRTGGPIGLAVFGDPHLDNPGCNFPLLRKHTKLIQDTDGLFAGSVGDIQDGWIGRLRGLWAQQGITAAEARELVKWWMRELHDKLIFLVEGNHDAWTNDISGMGAIDWIAGQQGALAEPDGVRLEIRLPGQATYTINCRHDFTGRSMYNKAHGVTKAAMFGWRDDILLAGHTHEFGYNPVKDPMTGKVSHPVRLASYKHVDNYARERGLPDENVSECCVFILDPEEPDQRHRVTVFFNPEQGARYLTMLRRERRRK